MTEQKIYKAIGQVMADVGAVGKNDKNEFDKYKYRGIDAVMNALSPAMVKNHVFVIPEVLEASREERTSQKGGLMIYTTVKVRYTFWTDDGSSVQAVVIGEAMDRGDKSTNKAMSAAFKYACFQTFCIPTEEMHDSEADSPDPMPKEEKFDVDPDLVPHGEGMTPARVERLQAEMQRTGADLKKMLDYFKVERILDLTEVQYITCINGLIKKPDKA